MQGRKETSWCAAEAHALSLERGRINELFVHPLTVLADVQLEARGGSPCVCLYSPIAGPPPTRTQSEDYFFEPLSNCGERPRIPATKASRCPIPARLTISFVESAPATNKRPRRWCASMSR